VQGKRSAAEKPLAGIKAVAIISKKIKFFIFLSILTFILLNQK
jgi:hypothetical protein